MATSGTARGARKSIDFLIDKNRNFNNVLRSYIPRDPVSGSGYNKGMHVIYDRVKGTGTSATSIAKTEVIFGKGGNGSSFTEANPYSESSTQLYSLGARLFYGDREFRYVFMDGAVTAGLLLQQAAHVAHHTNMTVTNADAVAGSYSHAAGSTTLSVETAGDTDLTADLYAEGYIHVNDSTGEGQLMRVLSHPAHDHSSDPSVVITTYDPLATTIVKNSSQLSLTKNPYKDVVVAPTAETGAVIGATVIDMTDNYYGWAVTDGPAALLTSEAVVVLGHRVVRSDTDAGGVMAADSDPLLVPVGQVMASGVVDTEYALIKLKV